MISYDEAITLIRSKSELQTTEKISILDSLDRISADNIYSQIDLPSFNNSAMDGFAIKSNMTTNARTESPVKLKVGITIAAGNNLSYNNNDECIAIMTGAAVPDGYDAIIPIENVTIIHENEQKYILINKAINKSSNLRYAGEDVKHENIILEKNKQIRPQDIMLLAACGIHEIMVYCRITITLATSGEEITDNYKDKLKFGQIYNANAPLLQNLANESLFNMTYRGIIGDNPEQLITLINETNSQIIITTGAVSMGEWDFIPQTLHDIGAEIIFHKIAIRPGKPILFAKLKDGRYFFGLPGNPVSSFVGWRFFVIPLIRAILGKSIEKTSTAIVTNEFHKKHSLRQFLKANLLINDGVANITISKNQESFKIASLTTNNAWVISHENQQINSGDKIQFVPLIADLYN